ncbi:MAG TPA: ATP-binding protein [Caulobacteraceae bacterium]|nr:ATP-binding protein [Caulobacteraceae bacterium]
MNPADGKVRRLGLRLSLPLFAQVLSLVLLSVLAAEGLNLWILFQSPQAPPDIYLASEVVTAIQKNAPTPTQNGQPLLVRVLRAGDEPRQGGQRFERFLADEVAQRLNRPSDDVRVALVLDPHSPARQTVGLVRRLIGARRLQHGENPFITGSFTVGVRQPGGRWQVVEPQRHGLLTPWQTRMLLWFTITALALAPVAYLFSRRLAAPIAAFAQAAERLGRDPNAPPMKLKSVGGELKILVTAFNEMQDRLGRYVQDRTAMIAAVAHDLRTPLTRLRFRVEGVPEPLRTKMTSDMEQMDAMIGATMAFVRDATQTGERCKLELSSLVQSIADEMADTGADVTAESQGPVVIEGDPIALRRLVANLLENAVKFGERARARVYTSNATAVIEIDDNGPGLAAADRDKVFEPFYRGEPSRSRETGGAGLGLAVVRSVARAHGGDAVLENLPGGGLRARASLPI